MGVGLAVFEKAHTEIQEKGCDMNPMDNDAGIVTEEDFPNGLRCWDCKDLFENGQAYASAPSIHGSDVIVCAACAMTNNEVRE